MFNEQEHSLTASGISKVSSVAHELPSLPLGYVHACVYSWCSLIRLMGFTLGYHTVRTLPLGKFFKYKIKRDNTLITPAGPKLSSLEGREYALW